MTAKKTVQAAMEHNQQLAGIFRQMADCYRYLGADERFRANAYSVAAKTMLGLDEPVDRYADSIQHLDSLPGVGESIAAKIEEYLHSGKIATFEKLKQQVPFALLEMMEVEGVGPATLKLLHDKLGVSSKEQLVDAINSGRLAGIRGMGERKISNLRRVLKLPETKQRMPWAEANRIGAMVLHAAERITGVRKAALAGSLRRKKETVGDIDLLITTLPLLRKRVVRKITSLPLVGRVLSAGDTKISLLLKESGVQVDIRMVNDDEFGAALLYFTGSKEHNIALRSLAKQKGWKINEYGVFDGKGRRLAGRSEEEMYALFGMHFIPPEKRLGGTEIETALR